MPNAAQLLPPVLTPWQMFVTADVVVQGVMILLLVASVVTWTLFVAKGIELVVGHRQITAALRAIRNAAIWPPPVSPAKTPIVTTLIAAAVEEVRLSSDLPSTGVKDRIALRLHRIERAASRRMTRGTGLLASIGSCGPFVGLFGTVWGIMNSFVGISQAQTTSLAVVAPGIAEALLATACGLAAAIPAVLIYNLFARGFAGYRAGLGDLSAAVLAHASREVDRQSPAGGHTRPRPALVRGAAE